MRFWAQKYKTRCDEDPAVFSVYGYIIMDSLIAVAQKVGANLMTDRFIRTLDSMTFAPDIFGGQPTSYTATRRLGSDLSRLSQIQDGRWKVVSDYIRP